MLACVRILLIWVQNLILIGFKKKEKGSYLYRRLIPQEVPKGQLVSENPSHRKWSDDQIDWDNFPADRICILVFPNIYEPIPGLTFMCL